jgi:hypothetical protein
MFGSDHKAIIATISNTPRKFNHIAHDAITTIADDDITMVVTLAPARILATPVTPATEVADMNPDLKSDANLETAFNLLTRLSLPDGNA